MRCILLPAALGRKGAQHLPGLLWRIAWIVAGGALSASVVHMLGHGSCT